MNPHICTRAGGSSRLNHDLKNGPLIIVSEETRTSFSLFPFSRQLNFSKPLRKSDYIQRSLQNGQLEQLLKTLRSRPWPNGIHLLAVKRAFCWSEDWE